MDIGSRIREARKARKLSQEELARRAGMSLKGMSYIERGHIEDPHYSSLKGIADALGVSIGELLDEPALAGKVSAPEEEPGLSEEQDIALREIKHWIFFVNEWATDLEEWAYSFTKGADPAELPEQDLRIFVGGTLTAASAYRRIQEIVEPLAMQYQSEDLARSWRRLSRVILAMATPGLEQRKDELDRGDLPDNVFQMDLKSA